MKHRFHSAGLGTPIRPIFGAILGILVASCDPSQETTDPHAGSVDLALQSNSVLSIQSVSYSITGPSFSRSGTINVAWSSAISGSIGGLPAGTGYTITLTASDTSDAGLVCSGSATFSILGGYTTLTTVHLTCRAAPRTGSVVVNGTLNVCPSIGGASVLPMETSLGHSVDLSSVAVDADGVPSPLTYAWTATSGTLTGASSASATFTCTTLGSATLHLTVSDGDCTDTITTSVVCSMGATPPAHVVINEVESSGGVPGDWVELTNSGGITADLAGYVFRDNDDTHGYVLPAGTTLAPGAFLVLDEATFAFGLGAADAARLFDASATLVDSYAWTAHASTTYGRCPDGTGPFGATPAATKNASNGCGGVDAGMTGDAGSDAGAGTLTFSSWPGANAVATVDVTSALGTNVSDLVYQPALMSDPSILWAVRNGPSMLYRLVSDGTNWASSSGEWSSGKTLRYPSGVGSPDAEGATKAEWADASIYVVTERDNDVSSVSRMSILRFDPTASGTSLIATHEWNLTSDLPVSAANVGLEAIAWVPDAHLVAKGFRDERLGATYAPASYANHGTGLFFVGLEGTGGIYAYALDHLAGTALRVATLASGQAGVMALSFDRDVGVLWTYCDDTCGNRSTLLEIDTAAMSASLGRFALRGGLERPSTLGNLNDEGIAFAPESECVGGMKSFFWTDDGATSGHAIRRDTIPCGHFL